MERKPSLDLKRNFGFDDDGHTPDKRMRANSDSSVEPQAPDQSDESSCEAQKQEIKLIAAEAQIIKLESSEEKQKNIRKDMQIQFELEESSFEVEHLRNEQDLLACMQKQFDTTLDKVEVALEDYREAKEADRIHKIEEACWENEKTALEEEVTELYNKLLEVEVARDAELSEHDKQIDEIHQAMNSVRAEINKLLTEEVEIQTKEPNTSLLIQQIEQSLESLQSGRRLELQQLPKELRETYARACDL